MTVLKGLGAIASVSGWKAQVRKIARDRGLIKLAELGPPGSTPAVPTSSPGRKAKPKGNMSAALNITSTLVGSSKRKVTRPDVLFGKSTYRVVVESTRGMSEKLVCLLFLPACDSLTSFCSFIRSKASFLF